MNQRTRAMFAVLWCLAISAGRSGADAPSCAVLTFRAGDRVGMGQAGLMANRFSMLLEKTGMYEVLPRARVHKMLLKTGVTPDLMNYAVKAGTVLGVDYVVSGQVAASGPGFVLSTALVNVQRSETVKTAVYSSEAGIEDFVRMAPSENLQSLFDVERVAPRAATKEPVAVGLVAVQRDEPTPEATPPAGASPPKEPEEAVPPATQHAQTEPVLKDVTVQGLPAKKAPPVEPPVPVVNRPKPRKPGARMENGWTRYRAACKKPLYGLIDEDSVMARFVPNQLLEIGTRMTTFDLATTTSMGATDEERFLGTIDQLSAEQDSSPSKFFIRLFPSRWLGMEWTTDEVRAKTFTDSPNNHSDGSFVADGPILTFVARATMEEMLWAIDWVAHAGNPQLEDRYQWARRIRPYIGFGEADFSGSFSPEPWWHLGYADRDDWIADGSPTTRRGGRRRTINATVSGGDVTTYGCSVYVTDYFFVDLYWRTMDLEFDAVYTRSDSQAVTERLIPFDNDVFGFGAGFVF